MTTKNVLAVDLGASSGRVMLCSFDGETLKIKELHRFLNEPVSVNGCLYWDILRLMKEIKTGIALSRNEGEILSLGIDTWGVDFGLLASDGSLLSNPMHYRNGCFNGLAQKYGGDLYMKTGTQLMDFNTVFQLLWLKQNRPWLLEGSTLLFMPELIIYLLTGRKICEFSSATTSGFLKPGALEWDQSILEQFGINPSILREVTDAGATVGTLSDEIQRELGVGPIPVTAVCGHDTGSAMCAVPCPGGKFAFLSSGTWSLLGTELEKPLVNMTAKRLNLTNEGGYGRRISFLKNICGLWLLQESRRVFAREGKNYSFADMESMARSEDTSPAIINPDDPLFAAPGDIPSRIRDYCKNTDQKIPETDAELIRCIYASLACRYREVLASLEECTGERYDCLYVVGGGTKDTLLSQLTADECKIPVTAGPAEATVAGNALVSLIAAGEIASLEQGREIIARSDKKTFYPSR